MFPFYRMEGIVDPVMRKKGGPTKNKIRYDPRFSNTRRQNTEFGGCATATHFLLEALAPLRPGLGVTGSINKLLGSVQKMDEQSEWGQRAVALSACPGLLQGLNISRRLVLDNVIRHSFSFELSKQAPMASIDLPPLLPGVNCLHPKSYSFFQVIAVLGVIPDLYFKEKLDSYAPGEQFQSLPNQVVQTDWLQTNRPGPATRLELSLPLIPGTESYSKILSLAVRYGKLSPTAVVEPIPKAVASKVLAVA